MSEACQEDIQSVNNSNRGGVKQGVGVVCVDIPAPVVTTILSIYRKKKFIIHIVKKINCSNKVCWMIVHHLLLVGGV